MLVIPEWTHDPEHSPTSFGWYASRLGHSAPWPVAIPTPRANDALPFERVWLFHREGYPRWILGQLERHFPHHEERAFGLGCTLMLYSTSPDSGMQGVAGFRNEVRAAER